MLADDRPSAGMTFVVQLEMEGKVNRTFFQSAVEQALRRHPLLCSIVAKAKANRECWVEAEAPDQRIRWLALNEPIYIEGVGLFLDLRKEIGLRVWCQLNDTRALFSFVFHHACCDGIGAYQFIGDVLWYYADACGDVLQPLKPLDETDLPSRFRVSVSPKLVGFIKPEKVECPIVPCCPVAAVEPDPNRKLPYPNCKFRVFERDEFRGLRLRAQDRGLTVNELLLESLFVAISEWNREYGIECCNGDIAINMPLDLREPGQPIFSAINLVTNAMIRRSVNQIEDRSALENSLREECARLKRNRFSTEVIKYIVAIALQPAVELQDFLGEECVATAVFSNTGDPTKRFLTPLPKTDGLIRVGNLRLEDFYGVSPLRPETRIAVSVFSYRRRLRICMRTDARYLSDDASQAFLDNWMRYMQEHFQPSGT